MPRVSETTLAIAKLKELVDIQLSKYKIDINQFTTINRGDAFGVRRKWEISGLSQPAYILSFSNSYRLNVVKAEMEYRPEYVTSTYLGAYLVLSKLFPDTIIQPLTLVYKIVDLVLHHNIKLDNRPVFNSKHLLQSTDKEKIVRILDSGVIDAIELCDDLYIEIRGDKCFIYFLRPVREDDGLLLANVAKKFAAIC